MQERRATGMRAGNPRQEGATGVGAATVGIGVGTRRTQPEEQTAGVGATAGTRLTNGVTRSGCLKFG